MNYLKPAPHMALAKYYLDKGERLQAFYILEYARRARFPEAVFNQAFQTFFGATRLPDEKAETIFNRGVEFQRAGNLKQAEESFVKAAELAPNAAAVQTWTGRFFLKVKADKQRALQYYLNAYFLDPHAYETEFVESRIRNINAEASGIEYRQLIKKGVSPVKILDEVNPTLVFLALTQITAQWKPVYLKPVLDKMSHDDEQVRWQATEAIMKNVNRSFDETLRALLKDNDLRKRGLAAYIAIHLWKQESFDDLRAMLFEKAELLRFDALSALALKGGNEGLQIIINHRAFETNPTLKQLIDKTLESS